MNQRDFCNFVMGALAMAQNEDDGSVTLTPVQYEKIKTRYEAMLKDYSDKPQSIPPYMGPGGGGVARC